MKAISVITLIVVIASAILTWYGVDQSSKDAQSIREAVQEGNEAILEGDKAILEEIRQSNKLEMALLERDLSGFNPELEYQISSIGFEQHVPNAIYVEITNNHEDHTFVKNRWTITGEICTSNEQVRRTNYSYSTSNELDIRKGETKEILVELPDEFFEKKIGEQAFQVMIELEMKPYTRSSGPINIDFPRKTFIQFDLNEEREGWMPWIDVQGDMDCKKEPSIWGYAYLNTTSHEQFAIYHDWVFPEN